MIVSTIPEALEEDHSQRILVTERVLEEHEHEEKSTADSPSKGSFEGTHQDPPPIETNDQMGEASLKGKDAVVEGGPVDQNKKDPGLSQNQKDQTQQNPQAANNECPSNQKSPSPDQASIDQDFKSNNEEDTSAQPGGSSLNPQSSTSRISAAAGIPESLLQGLNVSTPEEALEKLLSGGSFNTNSEGTSTPVPNEEEARLEQANLEAKFIEDFLQRNVLDVIYSDPNAFFSLKALLQQLQTDRTKEAMLFLVNQVEALIDQFAKNQQMLINAQNSY
jgi:hypothetical protein